MDFFIQQTVNGVMLGVVYALFALGFSLILANLGVFHVAHEAIFTWGAISAWYCMTALDMGFWTAMALSSLAAGLLNVVAYFLLIRPIERSTHSAMAGFISSVGGLIILTELADITLGRRDVSYPIARFPLQWRATVGPVTISAMMAVMIVSAVVLFGTLYWLVERTQLGRSIKAVAFDREVAQMLGVNALKVSVFVFLLSGIFAGIAGVLIGESFNVVNAHLGSAFLVIAVTVAVIGGFGSIPGVIVGGLIVGVSSSYTIAYVTSAFRDVVIFGLLLVFLTLRPGGIFHTPSSEARA